MKYSKSLLASVCAVLLLSSPLIGQEQLYEEQIEIITLGPDGTDVVIIDDQIVVIDDQVIEIIEEREDYEDNAVNGFNPRYTSHPLSRHHVDALVNYGSEVKLEDGSHWLVRPEHLSRIADWRQGHVIAITQAKSRWFGSKDEYQIALYNENTDVFADVKINYLPEQHNKNTLRIADFKNINGELCMLSSDGFFWPLKEKNRKTWERWFAGDYIVVGTNNTWAPWWNEPNLIINMSRVHNGACTLIPAKTKKL